MSDQPTPERAASIEILRLRTQLLAAQSENQRLREERYILLEKSKADEDRQAYYVKIIRDQYLEIRRMDKEIEP